LFANNKAGGSIVLKDKVVIVTGSAQGIGKHAAKTFAQEHAKVVIADFNEDNAKKTAAELGKLTETLALHVDVRDENSVKWMVDQVINRFGQIDVHINNAAIVPHFAGAFRAGRVSAKCRWISGIAWCRRISMGLSLARNM
jgi:NAD(P)-dependent dehydrogenase (short-subunit alcohol dehydrogenase family)